MKFTIYSKNGCPYCEKIEGVLDLTKQDNEVLLLGREFTGQDFYDKFGEGSTFPQVVCDGKNLGGCIDTLGFLREQKIL